MKPTRSRKGEFTPVEMLIVALIIVILALIVIPRLMNAGRKAKEATLRGGLHQLRNAIAQHEADTGVYPAKLDDLVNVPKLLGNGKSSVPGWDGPYLLDGKFPVDPFTGRVDWVYDPKAGEVHSKSDWLAIDATNGKYNTW